MDFIKGVDISSLIEVERCGGRFYDRGVRRDAVEIFRDYGINTVRVRIWNDPYSEDGEPYGAGENDAATSLMIAKRATDAGMGVLMDFHYSDFWADPGKQFKPKAWEHLGAAELAAAVYAYTKETVGAFLEQGVNVTMVQVGNEVTNGLLWPEGKAPDFDKIARLIGAGIRAVRDADADRRGRGAEESRAIGVGISGGNKRAGDAVKVAGNADDAIRVMVHLDRGTDAEQFRSWFGEFTKRCTDFDVIGMSYYPFWNGSIAELKACMDEMAETYGKDVILAEISSGFTMEDYQERERLAASERKGYATKPPLTENLAFPITPQGQADFIRTVMENICRVKDGHGKGFVWWEPAWLPVPGSGWATPASLAYLHDPGPCGNEWANQALFDYDGNVLPALAAIRDFADCSGSDCYGGSRGL